MNIRKGREWGRPATGPADHEVAGDDADLASWLTHGTPTPPSLIEFAPSPHSDLARAVGLAAHAPHTTEVAMDALVLEDGTTAVNMIVLGVPPDRLGRFDRRVPVTVRIDGIELLAGRATTIVVAVGQWRRGLDLVPRGHPGDGRAEVQVYRLRPPERAAMRRRLTRGEHLPHPRILERAGRRVEVLAATPLALEVDGVTRPPTARLSVENRPAAYRLLV
ncbi:MAG: hypothetical protein ACT4OX_06805 [Actinomycetota bacterium]